MEKKNVNIQTVMNFVTVRNPKKVSASNGGPVVITPGPILESTNLYNQIIGINTKSLPSWDIQHTVLDNWAKTGNKLSSTEEVHSKVENSLVNFSDQLALHANSLTFAMAKELVNDQPTTINADVLPTLWENLLYYSLKGISGETAQEIMSLLRSDNFLTHWEQLSVLGNDQSVRAAAQAELLLPKEAYSISYANTETTIPQIVPDQTAIDARKQLEKKLKTYLLAHQEITTVSETNREIHRATRQIDNAGYLNPSNLDRPQELNLQSETFSQGQSEQEPDLLAGISKRSQDVIKELGLKTNLSPIFILGRLQTKIDGLTRDLWEDVQLNREIISVGGALWAYDEGKTIGPENKIPQSEIPGHIQTGYEGFYFNDGKCRIKPLGIADFRRVEMELCCYKPGEVAHIENILQGEYKERSTRRLRRTEETFIQEFEREEERQRDTVSTERFELQKETSSLIEKETSFDIGVSVAGGYGPVSVTVNTNFATSTATTESDKQAINYAKEITNRSLQRVVERLREQRISKVIEEFEENNKHGLDNRGGDKHVVGLYRWTDKIYKAQVVNYGKRLMFEFMIPEPGAFYLWAMAQPQAPSGVKLNEPIDPRSPGAASIVGKAFKKHTDLDPSNYALLAAQYGANVEAPPAATVTVEKVYSAEGLNPDANGPHFCRSFNDLAVPEGYNPVTAKLLIGLDAWVGDGGRWMSVHVGNDGIFVMGATKNGLKTLYLNLPNELETIPVVCMGRARYFSVNVCVECERTASSYEAWQIKTYKAVLEAYNAMKAKYDSALAELNAPTGINIQGTNPAMNRQIEQQELKKGCIGWLHYGQNFIPPSVWYYSVNNDWTSRSDENDCNSPVTNYDCKSILAGERVKFFEQAFDWRLMTYTFYSYFWASKCRWRKLYQLNDADPLFLNFLQSGMARVLVPVRPGFEKPIMHYLRTGQIWQGQDLPGINSPIYLSIVEEMKEPIGKVEGEPWEIRIPTSLTVLQCESGCIEGEGLPCECDPDNGFGTGEGGKLVPGGESMVDEHG